MSELIGENSVKILWVHDDFDGPINGLAEYKGEKVWFSRSLIPTTENEVRMYSLIKLDPEMLSSVEENHVAYCKETGSPFHHGDPIRIKGKTKVVKMDLSKIIPEGEDGVDTTQRVLANIKIYNHSYDPQQIYGEFITKIKETDITNYFVPRKIEMI